MRMVGTVLSAALFLLSVILAVFAGMTYGEPYEYSKMASVCTGVLAFFGMMEAIILWEALNND